jgi:hypothetical protein
MALSVLSHKPATFKASLSLSLRNLNGHVTLRMQIDGTAGVFVSKLCDVRWRNGLTKRERGDQLGADGSSRLTSLWKMASKPGS